MTGTNSQRADWFARVTAVLALMISVFGDCSDRKHQRLSLQPILTSEMDLVPNRDFYGLLIRNVGQGTATIRRVFVIYDRLCVGRLEDGTWDAILARIGRITDASLRDLVLRPEETGAEG
jgi:hypothetical protein